ncbi:hypothetical protein ACWYVZ_05860 [Pediococcus acidilactici]
MTKKKSHIPTDQSLGCDYQIRKTTEVAPLMYAYFNIEACFQQQNGGSLLWQVLKNKMENGQLG